MPAQVVALEIPLVDPRPFRRTRGHVLPPVDLQEEVVLVVEVERGHRARRRDEDIDFRLVGARQDALAVRPQLLLPR
jgi:hypothetical protein